MKKFLISAFVGLALVFGNVSAVLAAHYWEIKMSEPKATSQLRTFNLEFVTLSETSTDRITVELFQNSASLGTKTTTKSYGDSGMFTVTVPTDGTYQYAMKATNDNGGEVQNLPTKTVTVTSQGSTSTITTSSTGGNGAGGSGSASSAAGDATEQGTAAGAETGQVDGGTTATEGGDTKGADSSKEGFVEKYDWPLAIAAGLAALGGLYWWVFVRNGVKNPFAPRD